MSSDDARISPVAAGGSGERSSEDARYLAWLVEETPEDYRRLKFPPDPRGLYSPRPCSVSGCERGSSSTGLTLCRIHREQYLGGEWSSLGEFLPDAAVVKPVVDKGHGGNSGKGIINLEACSAEILRAELAFVISRRGTGEYGAAFVVSTINAFIQRLEAVGVTSIRDLDSELKRTEVIGGTKSYLQPFGMYMEEFPSWIRMAAGDVNVKRRLGRIRGGSHRWSAGQLIEIPWLRQMVSRWVTYRLDTRAASPQHIGAQERHLVLFAEWAKKKGLAEPEDMTRDLLLAWIGKVNSMQSEDGRPHSAGWRSKRIAAVSALIQFARIEVTDRIPGNAFYLPGELPERDKPKPRFLEPRVIDTLRRQENLALISDPSHRTAMLIMMQVGLRAGHTCSLPFDCLIDLNRGAPNNKWALSFLDTKSNDVLTVPVEPLVAAAIREQQSRAIETSKSMGMKHAEYLFPNPVAPITKRLAPERLSTVLKDWVRKLDVREHTGELVVVTAHRFRHTFATEMLAKGVPMEIVQKLLGHRSIASTEIYAHATDTLVRAEWEKAKFINVQGELLDLPTGEAAEAEFLLYKIGRAVQPLPNGWCGLPIQQSCPHANACLDNCPNFLTSAAFLPVHEAQSADFDRTISAAEKAGHLRIIEINRRPNDNLKRIIATIREQEVEDATEP